MKFKKGSRGLCVTYDWVMSCMSVSHNHTYAHAPAHAHAHAHIHIHTHTHTHTHTHVCVCLCVCVYVRVYACVSLCFVRVHACVCICTYACAGICAYVCTHTHTCISGACPVWKSCVTYEWVMSHKCVTWLSLLHMYVMTQYVWHDSSLSHTLSVFYTPGIRDIVRRWNVVIFKGWPRWVGSLKW